MSLRFWRLPCLCAPAKLNFVRGIRASRSSASTIDILSVSLNEPVTTLLPASSLCLVTRQKRPSLTHLDTVKLLMTMTTNELAPRISEPAEFAQRRFATETNFNFAADEMKFVVKDKSGSHTLHTQYVQIGTDRDFLVERNTWLQNVGLLWLALGAVFTAIAYFGADRFQPSIWLFVGAACVAAAHWRTVRYTKLPTEKGTILVINDAQHDSILQQIEARRMDQMRRWYDFFDAEEEPARQKSRFEWLRREGVLSEDELGERLRAIENMVRVEEIPGEFVAVGGSASGRSLN